VKDLCGRYKSEELLYDPKRYAEEYEISIEETKECIEDSLRIRTRIEKFGIKIKYR